ncbi:hypothetical protein H6F46_18950 [Limnothrix sp. FACHB-1083]|nr:element excision factor XisH family protein [Limnothrix sp. FACHB-1083]MBD2162767.1 hypothetical protein [Limnothrix sp. FACHB-1083]MBD2193853.1 hypothetical protein [Limnothrix sp. FACHB-1088]
MSRKDQFHEAVKHGLNKEGWTITPEVLNDRFRL